MKSAFILTPLLLLLALASSAFAANPFFAMDNIARGGPDVAPAMLKELGYDGFGGRVPDVTMLPAVQARGLKFFNGYHVLDLNPAQPAPNAALTRWLVAMRGLQKITCGPAGQTPSSLALKLACRRLSTVAK